MDEKLNRYLKLMIEDSAGNDLLEAFKEVMPRIHRTTQQCFWRTIQSYAKVYANEKFDLRNEASIKFAKEISLIDIGLPLI